MGRFLENNGGLMEVLTPEGQNLGPWALGPLGPWGVGSRGLANLDSPNEKLWNDNLGK